MIGKKVKLYLKNNSSVEGIVSSWTKDEIVLTSPPCKDTIIIYMPKYNIVMAKIYDEQQEMKLPIEIKNKEQEEKFDLKGKDLVELRIEHIKQEKEEIAKSMTSWKLDKNKTIGYYDQPSFAQPSAFNNSSKEDKGSIITNNSGLPRVQRKSSKIR